MKIAKIPYWTDLTLGLFFALFGILSLSGAIPVSGVWASTWVALSFVAGGAISVAMALSGVSEKLTLGLTRLMFRKTIRSR